MPNIPQKYLNSTSGREALAITRHCLASGMTVMDMASQLTARYRRAGGPVRSHLGRFLTAVYDFDSPDTARDCARLFNLELFDDLTVSQSIYITGYESNARLPWRKRYSSKVTSCSQVIDPYQSSLWPMTVSPSATDNVLTIDIADAVYAIMTSDGTLNLFVLENTPGDILIDEDPFVDEAPLYFTSSTHFTSPVFRIKLAKQILDHCLMEIGYPHIPVKMTVIFTAHDANLINLEDYTAHEAWKDIELLMLKTILPKYAFNHSRSLIDKNDRADSLKNQMRAALIYSICATSILYHSICDDNLATHLNPRTLAAQCKKNNIFDR